MTATPAAPEGPPEDGGPGLRAAQKSYDHFVRRRLRLANAAAWLRAGGVQAVWLLVLLAGAAIPLVEALAGDGWTWLSPVLGFVVVVGAGLERIFSRTTDAAVALDRLRRQVAHERRVLLARSPQQQSAAFATYLERVEAHIGAYDDQLVEYNRRLSTGNSAESRVDASRGTGQPNNS